MTTNTGPTLNQRYNLLLMEWARQGFPTAPACEDCGCDLTGKMVHETATSWLCASCKEADDTCPVMLSDREDFHADL